MADKINQFNNLYVCSLKIILYEFQRFRNVKTKKRLKFDNRVFFFFKYSLISFIWLIGKFENKNIGENK